MHPREHLQGCAIFAQAALGQDIPPRRPTSEVTLRAFLDDTYEPWMKSTCGQRTTQIAQVRSAFRDLLDLKLSEFTTARVERWRVSRKFCHADKDAPAKRRSRELKWTINRNLAALRAALNRATEWGIVSSMPLGKIRFRAEDENAVSAPAEFGRDVLEDALDYVRVVVHS